MNLRCLCAVPLLLAVACASTGGAGARSEGPRGGESRRELKPRWKIPLAARETLTRRMARHGDQMILLMESVVLLNYELAEELARELAEEPKLSRPASGEQGTVEALLPAAFFKYQDELTERARELAEAARARSDDALTESLSAVTKTCVGCHAAYLYEGDDPSAPAGIEGPSVGDESAPADGEAAP